MQRNKVGVKRILLLTIVAAFLIFAFAACTAPAAAPAAQDQGTAAEPAAAPAEVKMLELYHDKASWADNTDIMGQAAAEAIGVGFASVPFPDTTTYQSTVRAALGTDKAPDMFTWWSGYRMEDIVNSGGAEDLSAIWDKYLASGEYTPGIASAYTFDGKVYAVPFNVAYWVVYYNKSLFEENGLQPPTTWDEFMALNDTLLEKGVTPLAMTLDGRWPTFIIFEEMILRTAGPDFYDKLMSGEAKYTDPEVVKAMEVWKGMIEKGYFTDPGISFGTGDNAMLPLFQNGQVAMIPIGDWYSATLTGAGMEPGVDYGAFIMPNENPDLPAALFFETGPLLVSANGPNKEDAIKIADWWMSEPAQKEWSSLMGFTSPNAKAETVNPVSSEVVQWIGDNEAIAVQRYWEATPPDIVETAVDEFARFMLNPDQYMEVLNSIQQKADSVWADR